MCIILIIRQRFIFVAFIKCNFSFITQSSRLITHKRLCLQYCCCYWTIGALIDRLADWLTDELVVWLVVDLTWPPNSSSHFFRPSSYHTYYKNRCSSECTLLLLVFACSVLRWNGYNCGSLLLVVIQIGENILYSSKFPDIIYTDLCHKTRTRSSNISIKNKRISSNYACSYENS